MDLGVWWQARRWKALLDLIDLLPADSRLNEARLTDPAEAELLAEARERAQAAGTDDSEWSPAISQYDLHAHLLRQLINITLAAHTEGKGQPLPGPRTALDEALEQRKELHAARLIAEVTPDFAFVLDELLAEDGPNPST